MTIPAIPGFIVLRKAMWTRRTGYLGACVDGQITEIRTRDGLAWVRENFQYAAGSFHVHSSARLGVGGGVVGRTIKPGMNPDIPSKSYRNVLELCTEHDRWWATTAELVSQADVRKRPVVRNRSWTPAVAARYLPPEPVTTTTPPKA